MIIICIYTNVKCMINNTKNKVEIKYYTDCNCYFTTIRKGMVLLEHVVAIHEIYEHLL